MNRNWIPEFSLVHPTARPSEWKKTRDLWIEAARNPDGIEHVVCMDWGSGAITPKDTEPSRLVWNYGKHCSVDATNVAAQCAVGKVLVVISDDTYPCPYWDANLRNVPGLFSDKPCVVRVRTGGTGDDRGLLTIQILNRIRYEKVGYLFHPAFASMFSDDEFSIRAAQDGVLVDAPDILMPHEHWTTGERPKDSVYERQNAPARYKYGAALLRWRQDNGWPNMVPPQFIEARGKI